jgi:hypothetical protein
MTMWTRDRTLRHCGQCGADIPIGDVFLLLTFNGRVFKKYRCAMCAGPAPPELPAAIVYDEPPPPIDLTRLGLLPLDFSRRDREPGMEG